jgi:hypothetical protein
LHPSEPQASAPQLRNPDMPLVAKEEAEELPLSPRHSPMGAPVKSEPEIAPEPEEEPPAPPAFEPPWRLSTTKPPQATPRETLWPLAERSPPPGPAPESTENIESSPEEAPAADDSPDRKQPEQKPPVAILKSGVVDGMGYTLYVDGSIEAELPDGTLRFASINELRTHLEQNS